MSGSLLVVDGRDYPHTREFDRVGAASGLSYRAGDAGRIARHVLSGAAFDAAEFSVSAVMILAGQGRTDVVPIPVFPARAFFHSYLFVRRDSAFASLADLAGRRIGLRDFASTGAIWFRGLLADEGIDWRGIEWVTGPGARFAAPPGVRVRPAGGDLEQMLLDGQIDLFFSARVEEAVRPEAERRTRLLLADTNAAEAAYARRTGLFPIIHAVVLSTACVQACPDAPRRVFDAYAASRAAVQVGEPDPDLPPYGLTPSNRHALATLGRYLADQGLIAAPPDLDTLFAADAAGWT